MEVKLLYYQVTFLIITSITFKQHSLCLKITYFIKFREKKEENGFHSPQVRERKSFRGCCIVLTCIYHTYFTFKTLFLANFSSTKILQIRIPKPCHKNFTSNHYGRLWCHSIGGLSFQGRRHMTGYLMDEGHSQLLPEQRVMGKTHYYNTITFMFSM